MVQYKSACNAVLDPLDSKAQLCHHQTAVVSFVNMGVLGPSMK